MIKWTDSYNDICAELRIMQIHEMELRKRVELAHTVMFSGEMPSSGAYCHLPLDKGIARYNAAVEDLEAVQAEVDRLNDIKMQMEDAMQGFGELGNRILYERYAKGKKYKQIAHEMGYTEQYLREVVSKKTYKKPTQSTNVS